MNYYIISIFPDIFESFFQTSLIKKALDKNIIKVYFVDPRCYCLDKHRQIDDKIYGGGKGMLLKAKPFIQAINNIIKKFTTNNFQIIYLQPAKKILTQKIFTKLTKYENIILISGRYEGIDCRMEKYLTHKYPHNFQKISLGKYIIMGGEVGTMLMIEGISRLLPGVIKEQESTLIESYSTGNNIEFPQYTRPEKVYTYKVPQVLLSGNHQKIQEWRNKS